MAAYLIKYRYSTYDGFIDHSICIIDYEKFEKVNEESFYKKFEEKINNKHLRKSTVAIEDVTKL